MEAIANSPFGKLPPELRHNIYELAFEENTFLTSFHSSGLKLVAASDAKHKSHNAMGLTGTCKLLRSETLDISLSSLESGKIILLADTHCNSDTSQRRFAGFANLASRLPEPVRSTIRHVEIELGKVDINAMWEALQSGSLAKRFKALPNIEKAIVKATCCNEHAEVELAIDALTPLRSSIGRGDFFSEHARGASWIERMEVWGMVRWLITRWYKAGMPD